MYTKPFFYVEYFITFTKSTPKRTPNKTLFGQKKFSEPRIYTGGVDITLWNELSKEEQNNAISKDWYIYYKFLDDTTGKLKRMPNI